MGSRRLSRIFDERSMDLGSELEDFEEEDILAIRIRREFSKGAFVQIVTPSTHPVRTDFGPGSLHDFLRARLDQARTEGRDVQNVKPNQNRDAKGQTLKAPRPGFQRSVNYERQCRHKTRSEARDEMQGIAPAEGSHDVNPQSPLRRPRNAPTEEANFEDSTEKTVRKRQMFGSSSPTPDTCTSSRRSKKIDLSDLNAEDSLSLSTPQGNTAEAFAKAGNDNKENVVFEQKLATEGFDFADLGTVQQLGESSAIMASTQEQPPSLISELEAFQQEEKRRFTSNLSVDTTQPSHHEAQLDGARIRRSSRNAAFEEHVNAKRQSWRKEDEASHQRLPGDAQNIDDDSPRVRKPPSGRDTFPLLIENIPPAPNFTNSASLSAVGREIPQSNLAALVDGMFKDYQSAKQADRPSSSPAVPTLHQNHRLSLIQEPESCNNGRNSQEFLSKLDNSHEPQSAHDRTVDNTHNSPSSLQSSPSPPSKSSLRISVGKQHSSTTAAAASTSKSPIPFEYEQIVPEILPDDMAKAGNTKRRSKAEKIFADKKTDSDGWSKARKAKPTGEGPVGEEEAVIEYPRTWNATDLPVRPNDPPCCPISEVGGGWPERLPSDLFTDICEFLSHEDVRNLRLVSKAFGNIVSPILFRSVVTKFGRSMFDINKSQYDGKPDNPSSQSLFQQFGEHINKFGISFEVDLTRLAVAEPKVISLPEKSWFGEYIWPVAEYPRFKDLKSIEDLVDNNSPLLRDVLRHLSKTSELALSIDSGHGWLNGADLSDLEVFRMRCDQGTKVFGKAFKAEDKWHEHGLNQLVKWAQQNTLNEATKFMYRDMQDRSSEISFLKSVVVRDYESFRVQGTQPDRDRFAHTGGRQQPPIANQLAHQIIQQHIANPLNLQPFHAAIGPLAPQAANVAHHNPGPPQHIQSTIRNATAQQGLRRVMNQNRSSRPSQRTPKTQPQWPLIFSGYNLAAEVGGHCNFIQNKIAPPHAHPLRPGDLTEAQAQWLMETVWAQRGFLSAYTTAIIMNKTSLRTVHSLHIAKLSSGLLPSLAQREFWSALPGLKTLTLLVSPDWRTEHIPGDRAFNINMLVSPVQASVKFAEFLHQHISRIEHLSSLSIGFVGGGEHAAGICARNQNILPAPITSDPRSWLSDHKVQPDPHTMIKFDHIRELTFENCWFSPCMLEGFMAKSRDTSLRHLVLNSVSLTGINSSRTEALTSADSHIRAHHGIEAWLQETLPNEGCWPSILDRLTPGTTFFERKVAAGMIPEHELGMPENKREFRGNVEKITLKSCGYVKVSGVAAAEFNQNGVITSNRATMDESLRARKNALEFDGHIGESGRRRMGRAVNNAGPGGHFLQLLGNHGAPGAQAQQAGGAMAAVQSHARRASEVAEAIGGGRRVMMSRIDPETGSEYVGLGKMTQVIHPVEKRVLEQAWGMKFGWGDDMERFAAVEDGCFEGGTGRFSGVVAKKAAQ